MSSATNEYPLRDWIETIRHEWGEPELADSMDYLLAHEEEYSNGRLDWSDLPIPKAEDSLFRVGVAFGVKWEQEFPGHPDERSSNGAKNEVNDADAP